MYAGLHNLEGGLALRPGGSALKGDGGDGAAKSRVERDEVNKSTRDRDISQSFL